MEGTDLDILISALLRVGGLLQAVAHLLSGPVGEGYRGDLSGVHASDLHQILQAGDQGFGLSRAGTGNDRHGPVGSADGFLLQRVQGGQEFLFLARFCPVFFSQVLLFVFSFPFCPLHAGRTSCSCGPRFFLLHPLQLIRGKQRKLPLQAVSVLLRKQADFSVFSVETGRPLHPALPQAADPFRHQRPRRMTDLLNGRFPQDIKFRPQLRDQPLIRLPHLFPGRAASRRGRDHLRKRNQTFKGLRVRPHIVFRPVRQLLHPVQHADGDLFPADRTAAAKLLRLLRADAEAAFSVAVKMILPFLREKFQRSGKPLSCVHSLRDSGIGQLRLKQRGLPPQLRRGVGVRIGNQKVGIQRGNPPVHGRIRGKPRFQRMDVRRQIPEAFLDGIKTGKSPEQRKMGRPDMSRNVYGLRTGFQHDLQQIPAVQSQDRPAVRMDVSDQLQPSGKGFRLLKAGQQEQAVHLAHPFIFLINGADLSRHQKTRLLFRHAILMDAVFLFQHIKPVLRRLQLLHKLRPPCGMGEIPCSQNMDPLFSRLKLQMLRIAVFARGPRKPGMYVQVSDVCPMCHLMFPLPA